MGTTKTKYNSEVWRCEGRPGGVWDGRGTKAEEAGICGAQLDLELYVGLKHVPEDLRSSTAELGAFPRTVPSSLPASTGYSRGNHFGTWSCNTTNTGGFASNFY